MKKLKIAALVLVAIIIVYSASALIIENRSLQSKVVEDILHYFPNILGGKSIEEKTKACLNGERETYVWPEDMKLKTSMTQTVVDEMNVYALNSSSKNKTKILYIHGGAYLYELRDEHIAMLDKIAKRADVEILIPDYPLTPEYTFDESYPKVLELYMKMLESSNAEDIVVMGDSAGGGYSLGLSLMLKDKHLPQPKELILLSPWLDVTMSNPDITEMLLESDKTLMPEELKKIGDLWAGDMDPTHYIVSPLFGDHAGLPPITTFIGTYEIFYPDAIKFHEKLNAMGQDNTLLVYEKMQHVFPAYPIPEADKAINEMVDIITL